MQCDIRQIEEGLKELVEWEKSAVGTDGQTCGRNLSRFLREADIDAADGFFVGICAGISPDEAERISGRSFGEFSRKRFDVFSRLEESFLEKEIGIVAGRDWNAQYILGVFSDRDRESFIGTYVEPIRRRTEEACGTRICVGVGSLTEDPAALPQSFDEAGFAFGLYPFEEQKVIDIRQTHRESREAFEDYKVDVDQAFRSILTKDEHVMDRIDCVLDDIEALHYGNWQAVVMRTMIFTGELGFLLSQYRLLDVDFYEMQDALQAQVEMQYTMNDLRQCVRAFYEDLIPRIYAKGKSQEKVLIEDVKKYIREHYTEDLSIRELAAVACVSPNYFSAMFKKETGQNYKAYLTSLRMDEAIRLLQNTDYKTYEIGEKVGYNNVRRFVDAFKQIYTVSPMEYKKKLRKA